MRKQVLLLNERHFMRFDEDFSINGTLIWYYYICKREVWLMGHSIEPDQENDYIVLGNYIHEIFYTDRKKEIKIDNVIKIDVLPGKRIIGEIKKSSKFLESAKMQVAFYLYYMKFEKNLDMEGMLLIPEERKRIKVFLTPTLKQEVERAIKEIKNILRLEKPPKAVKIPYCSKCAYRSMCWT